MNGTTMGLRISGSQCKLEPPLGGDDESHRPRWSVVKRKRRKNGPAISTAASSGTSSVENVKRGKVLKNKSNGGHSG